MICRATGELPGDHRGLIRSGIYQIDHARHCKRADRSCGEERKPPGSIAFGLTAME
jgi:hypothetical protein